MLCPVAGHGHPYRRIGGRHYDEAGAAGMARRGSGMRGGAGGLSHARPTRRFDRQEAWSRRRGRPQDKTSQAAVTGRKNKCRPALGVITNRTPQGADHPPPYAAARHSILACAPDVGGSRGPETMVAHAMIGTCGSNLTASLSWRGRTVHLKTLFCIQYGGSFFCRLTKQG